MSRISVLVRAIFRPHGKTLFQPANRRNIFSGCSLLKQVSFRLSDIGEGIREVTIKEWFVKVGDKVSQFDNICEVQSDKASVTITSRYDGTITKLHYKVDDVALVGQPLVDLETEGEGEDKDAARDEIEAKPNDELVVNEAPLEVNGVLCIPSVRRLAKEHKLDLTKVTGTGKSGRILKEDVLKYLDVSPDSGDAPRVGKDSDDTRLEPIKGFAKVMFKTMTEALKIPEFVYKDEIKVTKLVKLRQQLKERPNLDIKITLLPFIIKAASNGLLKYPIINSSLDEKCENIIYRKHHNIGIAMDTSQGLAIPVIKNVETLTVLEIAKELNRLTTSGRNGTFSPSDLSNATFTVSNIGSIGGTYAKPVVLPPQVALLAIGMTRILPRFDENGNVVREDIINVSGAGDHRILDGATMAHFIKLIKQQLEDPYLLFLNL